MARAKPKASSGSGRTTSTRSSPFHDRFLFRGHATALSGHLRRLGSRQDEHLWPAVGSVALPITGGLAEEQVTNWKYPTRGKPLISVGRVFVRAKGDFVTPAKAWKFTGTPQPHWANTLPTRTTIETVIENLTIHFNKHPSEPSRPPVEVGKIKVTWTSDHPRTPKTEPEITLTVSVTNFLVHGQKVELTAESAILDRKTYEDLKKKYENNNAYRGKVARHFGADPKKKSLPKKRGGRAEPEIAMCRIFKDLTDPPPPHTSFHDGYSMKIEEFGWIYLGEMAISPADRRMTVMRMAVGSERGGELGVGDGGTDGAGWPPSP